MGYHELKDTIAAYTVQHDALHIYAAMFIQLGAAVVLRRSLARWVCWCFVLVVELFNEVLDVITLPAGATQHSQLPDALHDIINSMVLPTILLVVCRYYSSLAVSRRTLSAGQKGAEQSSCLAN